MREICYTNRKKSGRNDTPFDSNQGEIRRMLARRELPTEFIEWNKRWGAPSGYPPRIGQRFWGRLLSNSARTKLAGPFSIQKNSPTRRYEYPWAFYAIPLAPGMRVVDVGGGLAGFQFVLSQAGAIVTNVDPGLCAKGRGWKCDLESVHYLNRLFGTTVELRSCTLSEASLQNNAYDVVYSISVMEHVTDGEFWETANHVWDCLKIGGRFVITVDLYLNLLPFTSRKSNEYGVNFPVGELINFKTFSLVTGDVREIYGTTAFDKERILTNLEDYSLGEYPVLAQCLVLEKQ